MKFLKKRKIRVDILTIFLSLFSLTVILIIYYFYTRSTETLINVGADLIERNNQAVVTKLDDFFRPTPFVKISNFLLNDEVLTLNDMESLTAFMHIILQSYPQLINAYLADNNGNLFIESNAKLHVPFMNAKDAPKNARFVSESITHKQQQAILTVNYKDAAGEPIKKTIIKPIQFDPRTRPWFIGAKQNPQQQWIGIYPSYETKEPVITLAFAILVNQKIAGVAAADLNMALITKELKKYSLNSHGQLFIVNNRGEMITSTTPGLSDINQQKDGLIKQIYNWHQQNKMNYFIFKSKNNRYIVNFTPYALSPGEEWEIASIVPVDTFVKPIKLTNYHILIFSLVMLMLGIISIVLSSIKISKPIMDLAQETNEIIKLKFDKPVALKTHIYEIQVMIDALNAAKSALSSFAKYVPKVLVEQLIKTKMIAQLGGEKRNISILFSDIANFTQIAEHMDPEELIIHLSEYLNTLTQVIHNHHGSIDKYIGDAIMSFWGAPMDDAQHLFHACDAVLALQKTVHKLNDQWAKENKPILHTRFGLNTGSTIVGNMGSSDRMNYTVIGDAVNLAARLEALNKTYHTEIIVSPAVYSQCHSQYLFRPLDIVKIRGKRHSITIYEMINKKPGTKEQIELCELTAQGFYAFHHDNFELAKNIFKTIAEKFPEDKVAEIYLQRL